MTIKPAYRPTIVKKRTKRFIRHQSDRYAKLKVSFPENLQSEDRLINLSLLFVAAKLAQAQGN